MTSRSLFRAVSLSGLALLAACASDRAPLLEDDPRSRAARGAAAAPLATPPPVSERAPERVAEAPAAPTAPPVTAARAPFRAPEADETSDGRTDVTAGGYAPRPPQIAGAPDPSVDAALDRDPYFAGEPGRASSPVPSRVGAPARVGADAGRGAGAPADGAPFRLRGEPAPDAPEIAEAPAPVREASRPAPALPTVSSAPATPPAAAPLAFLADPQGALDAVNAYRARYGYAPLAYSPVLSRAALDHARDLAARGEVTSVTTGGQGVIDRLAARGYRAGTAASLVSGGYDAFGDAMTSWRRDRVQRSRLLLPQATEIGIARVEDPRSPYRYYIEMIVATE